MSEARNCGHFCNATVGPNLGQNKPMQSHEASFFGVTLVVPHAMRTAVSLASVTTSVTTIFAKMYVIILVFGTQELQLFKRMMVVPAVSTS